jgi:hypothetical protein
MEHFLDKNYPDLAGSRPVERATKKAREGGEKIHSKDERIDSYLSRLGTLVSDERGFELLKHKVLSTYVTKPEEIPESYWKLQENIMAERGQLGDWKNMSDEQKEKAKALNAEGVLSDQESSLEQWLDYFANPDSKGIPDDVKYWVFRNIIKLQEFDKEKGEFPKRSRGTIKQFPDWNPEALNYVLDASQKKYNGGKHEFEYDIQPEERAEFEKYLEKEDFAKLYAWANTLMNPIPERLLKVTEGEWRKFEQDSDPEELVKTIRGKGTGWCTAGINTAKTQLEGGDFYVYYSEDDEGNAVLPRIAIRMENNNIAEVRGVAYKQNLDPFIGKVLEEKLEEFPDKEKYLKKEHDMQEMTRLVEKQKTGEEFTKEELEFLYEKNGKTIDGFGYQDDPRIEELLENRDIIDDYCVMYDCRRDQMVSSPENITEDTRVCFGNFRQKDVKILNNRKSPLVINGEVDFTNYEGEMRLPENIIFNSNAYFDKSSITKIPKGTIFNKASYFSACTSLATISDGVRFGGDVYFTGCTSLTSTPKDAIFNKVANFMTCTSLTTISPNTLFNGRSNFISCPVLTTISSGVIFNQYACFHDCTRLSHLSEDILFNDTNDYTFFVRCPFLLDFPETILKNSRGLIVLPKRFEEKYSKFPNVKFV